MAIDRALLEQLTSKEHDEGGYSSMVIIIAIIASGFRRGVPSNAHAIIAHAMRCIASPLDAIEKCPEIENPYQGVLGGGLTHTNLLRLRAQFHVTQSHKQSYAYHQPQIYKKGKTFSLHRCLLRRSNRNVSMHFHGAS